jgi:hypothetical protein
MILAVFPPPISTGSALLTLCLCVFDLHFRLFEETLGAYIYRVFRSNEVRGRKIEANRNVEGETNPGGAPKGDGCTTGPSLQPLYLLVSHFRSFFCLENFEAWPPNLALCQVP